jgi:hypothetical protein
VTSWGFRWRKDRLFARPVFRCEHQTCNETCVTRLRRGDNPCQGTHFFTGCSHARTERHPEGLWCPGCSRERTMRDGLPIANEWDFEARLIADALIAVGSGASYREAAQGMRMAARRYAMQNGVPVVSPWGGSVMRYLDHFGRLVLDQVEHKEWPEVLVLDAMPLRQRKVKDDDPFSSEQAGSGAILVAVGYTDQVTHHRRRKRDDNDDLVEVEPRIKRSPHVWRVAISGGYNRWAWADFLADLPGTPKWIVVDGEAPVRLGIKLRWGDGPDAPVIFSCEGHLQRKFRERALTQDKLAGIDVARLWPEWKPGVPADEQPHGPLFSRDDYRRLLDAVLAFPEDKVENITAWLRAHDDTIRRQFDLREAARGKGYIRGNGAAEATITKIGDKLGDRVKVIQNVYRINVMLGLMAAHMGHLDDAATYMRIVRDELERTNGRPKINWREHHFAGRVRRGRRNPEGSLFALADRYQNMGDEEKRAYWVGAQATSMEKKLLEHNIYHFLNGYKPLGLTQAKTLSVRCAGLRLRDFPLIRREWDPANSLDPDMVGAGYDKVEVGWICFEDPSHRWKRTVGERCARLLGCPECGRYRGAASRQKPSDRERLRQIRAAWGDYDEPQTPIVTTATIAAMIARADEDDF